MNVAKRRRKHLFSLKIARFFSVFLLLLASGAAAAAIFLPSMQKAAYKPSGSVVTDFEYFLTQLPRLGTQGTLWLFGGAVILLWLGYTLRTLVALAESQFMSLESD